MEPNRNLKIVIADDDSDDLEYLKFLFEKHNSFTLIKSVNSALAVLEFLENEIIPDVLLTDFYMPVMTGAELTKHLSELGIAPEMHIFIISTVINETQREVFSKNPNVHFLVKPANLTEINNIPGIILEKMGIANINRI